MSYLEKLHVMNVSESFNITSIINVYESFASSPEHWIHQSILPQFLEDAIMCGNDQSGAQIAKGLSEAIIQSCLSPSILPDNTYRFKMRDEIFSVEGFVSILLQFLELKFGEEKNWNLLTELRKFKAFLVDNKSFNPNHQFKGLQLDSTNNMNEGSLSTPGYSQKLCNAQPRRQHSAHSAFVVDDQKKSAQQLLAASSFPVGVGIHYEDYENPGIIEQLGVDFRTKSHFRRPDCQKKLLALIRKQGMDILFPMNTHDKVLSCIFVALRWNVALAHKELIDLVILVKDSNKVTQLDTVTKTKIRGLLSLLKNADVLTTHGLEGTPVLLALHPSIQSFEDLRQSHDNFIHLFALQSFTQFSVDQFQDILWPLGSELKSQRAALIAEFSRQLVGFLKENVKPPSDPLSMASILTFDKAIVTPISTYQQQQQQLQFSDQLKITSAESTTVPPVPVPPAAFTSQQGTTKPISTTSTVTSTSSSTKSTNDGPVTIIDNKKIIAKQISLDQFIDLGMYVSESGSCSSDRGDSYLDMLHATMDEDNVFADRMIGSDNLMRQSSEFRFQTRDTNSSTLGLSNNKVMTSTSMHQIPRNVSYEKYPHHVNHQTLSSNNMRHLPLELPNLGDDVSTKDYPSLSTTSFPRSPQNHRGRRSMDLTPYHNLGTTTFSTSATNESNNNNNNNLIYNPLSYPPSPYDNNNTKYLEIQQSQSQSQSTHHPASSSQYRYHSNSLSTLLQSSRGGSLYDRQQQQQQLQFQNNKGKSFNNMNYGERNTTSGGLSKRTTSFMRAYNKDPVQVAASRGGSGSGIAPSTAFPLRHNPNIFSGISSPYQNYQQQQPILPLPAFNRNVPPVPSTSPSNRYVEHKSSDNLQFTNSSSTTTGRSNGFGYNNVSSWPDVSTGSGTLTGDLPSSRFDIEDNENNYPPSIHSSAAAAWGNDIYTTSSKEGNSVGGGGGGGKGFTSSQRERQSSSLQQQQQHQQQSAQNFTDSYRIRSAPRLVVPEEKEELYDPNQFLTGVNVSNFLNGGSPSSVSGRSSFLIQEEMKEKFSKEQSSSDYQVPISHLPPWYVGNSEGQGLAQVYRQDITPDNRSSTDNRSFFSEDSFQESMLEELAKEIENKLTVDKSDEKLTITTTTDSSTETTSV